LPGSATERHRGSIAAGVRAHRAVSFVRAAIRRRVVHGRVVRHEDILWGVGHVRDIQRRPIRVRDDTGIVATRLGVHVQVWRQIACPILARFRRPRFRNIRRRKDRLVGRCIDLGGCADISLDDRGIASQVGVVLGISGAIGRFDGVIGRRACILLGRTAQFAGVEGTPRPTDHDDDHEPLDLGLPHEEWSCLIRG
jgi:hypothetical protein